MEKRHWHRDITEIRASLFFMDKELPCIIKNFSRGGALVAMDEDLARFFSPDDVGADVSLMTENSPNSTTQARIIRVQTSENMVLVALFFI
jgi:hypothetical protein